VVPLAITNTLSIIGNEIPISSWYHHYIYGTDSFVSGIVIILILAISINTLMLSGLLSRAYPSDQWAVKLNLVISWVY